MAAAPNSTCWEGRSLTRESEWWRDNTARESDGDRHCSRRIRPQSRWWRPLLLLTSLLLHYPYRIALWSLPDSQNRKKTGWLLYRTVRIHRTS